MANFFDRIVAAAESGADRTAVEMVAGGGVDRTSYRALVDEAAAIAAWLAGEARIGRGDRVAILAANDAHWVAAYLAALRLGAVAVPLDTAYHAADVHTILADSGARLVFTTPRYESTARAALDGLAHAPAVALLTRAWPSVAGQTIPAVAAAGDADAAVILYTSGTTADPKGVVLTHGNLEAERRGALEVIHVGPDDAVLGVLPLFHALAEMANLLLPLSAGARVVFLESVNSSTLLDALATRDITAFACVPQFFYLIHERVMREVAGRGRLARAIFRATLAANVQLRDRFGWNPGRRIFARVHRVLGPRMRILVTGGSRFDPAIARDLYGLGFTLQNAYGLTETTGGATIVRAGDRFTTSVGQPFPGVELRIDRSRRAASTGHDSAEPPRSRGESFDDAIAAIDDGEVLVHGPIVMREYFGRPDRTAEALADGWLRTGDLGWIDRDGRLYITGREKEIIVLASGKNLYPEEIEAHYRQSPFIKELAVLGLTDPGAPVAERLHAVIVPDEAALHERGIVNVRELIRFEIESLSVPLPPHKRILGYDISLDPLPRTTTGKLRRTEIARWARSRAAAESGERALTDAERAWLADASRAALAAIVARQTNRSAVRPDANLELDLGLDSMERVEVLTAVEEHAGRRVPAEARAAIFTVRQLVEAVLAAPASGATGARTEVDVTRTGSGSGGDLPWDRVLSEPPDPALVANLSRPKALRAIVCYAIARAIMLAARLLLGVRVDGRAHLPDARPFLVCPNHQTFFDGFLVVGALPFRVFRHLFVVGAAEFFETPFMAWLARAVNIVPLDPDRHLVTAMQAAAAGLGLGKVLVLFPEGERSIDGAPKPFRKGAAILASHLDAAVVPVAIDGLYEIWPRGRSVDWRALRPWRARAATIAFGAPIRVPRGDYAAGTAAIEQAVGALFAEIRSRTPPPR